MERENLFSVNTSRDDAVIDREEFIIRRESAAVAAERNRLDDQTVKAVLRSVAKGQLLVNVLALFCLLAGLYSGITALLGYVETKEFSLFLVIIAVSCIILSGVFFAVKKALDKKNSGDSTIDSFNNDEYVRLNDISRRELNIPRDAKTVEIFEYFYNDKGKYREGYVNDDVTVFEEDGKLCLYRVGAVIAVPLDSIEEVVKVKDRITFSDWMKDTPYDSGEYMQYNIVQNKVNEYEENYSMDGYYSIRFSREGDHFEILVPLYEMKPFFDILKREAVEE